MAEFVDSIDQEEVQQDEFQAEEVKQQQPEEQQAVAPEIPDKLKGKSMDDLIKMYQEAEKLIGRQAQEVGEVRRLADELIKRQITTPQAAAPAIEDDADFFADPVKAVNKAVATHPAIQQAQVAAAQMARMQTANRLAQTHADYTQVIADPEFATWVNESPVRKRLYMQADQQFDFDSANELLSNFKALKKVRQDTVKEAAAQMKEENSKQLRAATVSTSSSTGETSNKIYRRADLIRLQLTDPERYMQMQPEIMEAYASGRVR
jgi:hypothetical protein